MGLVRERRATVGTAASTYKVLAGNRRTGSLVPCGSLHHSSVPLPPSQGSETLKDSSQVTQLGDLGVNHRTSSNSA